MNYYYEPLQKQVTCQWVNQNIGCQALEYSCDRQYEIGLYPAYFDYGTPYNKYTHTVENPTWTKFENSNDLMEKQPGIYSRLTTDRVDDTRFDSITSPFYLQIWTVVELTGAAQQGQTQAAALKVATEVSKLLSSVTGFTGVPGCPDTVTTYATELLSLSTQSVYPHTLAQDVDNGTFASWPTYPDLSTVLESIAETPVAVTNADIAFKRIINAYSIPGTYPEKVAAITSAISQHGVDGSVTDLYNSAVEILTQ